MLSSSIYVENRHHITDAADKSSLNNPIHDRGVRRSAARVAGRGTDSLTCRNIKSKVRQLGGSSDVRASKQGQSGVVSAHDFRYAAATVSVCVIRYRRLFVPNGEL